MTQPALQDRGHDTAAEQMHGVAVPERMGRGIWQGQRNPLPGDGRHRAAEPVARRVVGDRLPAAALPYRPATVGTEGHQMIAQPRHEPRVKQRHPPL